MGKGLLAKDRADFTVQFRKNDDKQRISLAVMH